MPSGSSNTSKSRSTAVRASKVIDRRKPIDSIGKRSTVAVAKNANNWPTVSDPLEASQTPASRHSANATSGTSRSQSQIPATACAFSISVPRNSSACRVNLSSE